MQSGVAQDLCKPVGAGAEEPVVEDLGQDRKSPPDEDLRAGSTRRTREIQNVISLTALGNDRRRIKSVIPREYYSIP